MGLYENIKDAAKKKGYSINRLEKELGFARSYIGKFNTITPSADKIQKIADFLNVSSEYLMTGSDSKYSDADVLLDVRISEDVELKEAIKKYYSLDDHKQKLVIELINMLSK